MQTIQLRKSPLNGMFRVGVMMAIATLLLTSCAFNTETKSPLPEGSQETRVEDDKTNTKGSAHVEESTDKVMPKSSATQTKATEAVADSVDPAVLSEAKAAVVSTSDAATKQQPTKDTAENNATEEGADLMDTVAFILPSGNIYCLTYDEILRCDMDSLLNPMPSQPETCGLDWGGGVVLTADGPAEVLCAGDTIAGDYPTLTYGSVWRNGEFECTSETVGLTCQNATEQGFFLSRERWEMF